MRLFHRKSKLERMIDALETNKIVRSTTRTAIEAAVANAASRRQAQKVGAALDSFDVGPDGKKPGSVKRKLKSGLALVVGAAAVTAASASISNLRHRENAS